MTRHPLTFLAVGLASLSASGAARIAGAGGEPWWDLGTFALSLFGGGCLLAGFLAAAFLAGGRRVVWPMAVYVVVILSGVAAFFAWAAKHP